MKKNKLDIELASSYVSKTYFIEYNDITYIYEVEYNTLGGFEFDLNRYDEVPMTDEECVIINNLINQITDWGQYE